MPSYVNVSVRSCSVSLFLSLVALRHRQKIRKTKHSDMVCVQLVREFFKWLSCRKIAIGFFFPERIKDYEQASLPMTHRNPISL